MNVSFVLHSFSQCSISSTSGPDYTVTMTLEPIAVITDPPPCTNGYNYNIEMSYDISYSGANRGGMWTLLGRLVCGSDTNLVFDLPKARSNSTGTRQTYTNPYTLDTDCATTTPSDRGCGVLKVEIEGPGIDRQGVDCGPTSSSSLPIDLGSFTLNVENSGKVLLFWETLSELNNDYFSIEKSVNGIEWDIIGKINGAGNSSTKLYYNYVDVDGINGVTYYRLKQTDYDGKFKYFRPIFGNGKRNDNFGQELVVYPNPFNENLTVEVAEENINQVQIYSLDGKPLVNSSVEKTILNGKVVFNLSDLKPGMYVVKCNENVRRILKN